MSRWKRLKMVLVCAALQAGVAAGVPMRPDEVRDLLERMSAPKLAHVLPGREDHGDGGRPPKAPGGA